MTAPNQDNDKTMRKIFLLSVIILATLTARSQDFDYTVMTDSVSWQELNSQTLLNSNNSAWDFSYRIAIGFPFQYLGKSFDSLTIETNGYLVFDHDRNYAFTAFNEFRDRVDIAGDHATIGYESSGNNGNRILKIQFKNTGFALHDSRAQSWQIWIRENGSVELRVGPGDFSTDNSLQGRIGLVNQNMDTPVRGFFIGGDPRNPTEQPVDNEHPSTVYLDSIPAKGYRYTFSPSAN